MQHPIFNPLLLWGIAFEVAFAAAVIYVPALQPLFHTAPLGATEAVLLAPFPVVVWGADEIWRWRRRRRETGFDLPREREVVRADGSTTTPGEPVVRS